MKKLRLRSLGPKLYSGLRDRFVRTIPLGAVVALAAAGLLGYRLLSLVPFSSIEQPQELGSASLRHIRDNVLYAPTKSVQWAVLKLDDNDAWIRLASLAAALASAIFLYLLLRKWFTGRITFLAILMYVTSSWFLHTGRLGGHDALYLTVWPVLLLVCMWFLSKHHDKKMPFATALLAILLYIPGSWLFLLSALIVFRKFTGRAVKKLSGAIKFWSISAFIVVLLPLAYSFARQPRQFIEWLGFDTGQPMTLQNFANNFLDIPKQLFYSGLDEPLKWLGGTPVLDVFSVAMFILGLYAFRAGYYPAREKLVFGGIIISVLMIGIGQVATLSLLIPLFYIVIANGLAYMLQSWFTVFPRNPLARTTGVVLLTVVVLGSCFYQLQRYYQAWPNAEPTKSALSSRK